MSGEVQLFSAENTEETTAQWNKQTVTDFSQENSFDLLTLSSKLLMY